MAPCFVLRPTLRKSVTARNSQRKWRSYASGSGRLVKQEDALASRSLRVLCG